MSWNNKFHIYSFTVHQQITKIYSWLQNHEDDWWNISDTGSDDPLSYICSYCHHFQRHCVLCDLCCCFVCIVYKCTFIFFLEPIDHMKTCLYLWYFVFFLSWSGDLYIFIPLQTYVMVLSSSSSVCRQNGFRVITLFSLTNPSQFWKQWSLVLL